MLRCGRRNARELPSSPARAQHLARHHPLSSAHATLPSPLCRLASRPLTLQPSNSFLPASQHRRHRRAESRRRALPARLQRRFAIHVMGSRVRKYAAFYITYLNSRSHCLLHLRRLVPRLLCSAHVSRPQNCGAMLACPSLAPLTFPPDVWSEKRDFALPPHIALAKAISTQDTSLFLSCIQATIDLRSFQALRLAGELHVCARTELRAS